MPCIYQLSNLPTYQFLPRAHLLPLRLIDVGADGVLRARNRIVGEAFVVNARTVRIAELIGIAWAVSLDCAFVRVWIVLLVGGHRRHDCLLRTNR